MRSRSSPDRSPVSLARWIALLTLAAALWASQSLALVHQVAHEPGHVHDGELFAHHDDDPAQCRLIDQLAHLAPLAVPLAVVLLDVATAAIAERFASQPAGSAAEGYHARAPPTRA